MSNICFLLNVVWSAIICPRKDVTCHGETQDSASNEQCTLGHFNLKSPLN